MVSTKHDKTNAKRSILISTVLMEVNKDILVLFTDLFHDIYIIASSWKWNEGQER
jgi:hypothetical protein